jgi:hypothetical protein
MWEATLTKNSGFPEKPGYRLLLRKKNKFQQPSVGRILSI